MATHFRVVIVGAGLSGPLLALELARLRAFDAGSILLVERDVDVDVRAQGYSLSMQRGAL